jgi:hypothetical protein
MRNRLLIFACLACLGGVALWLLVGKNRKPKSFLKMSDEEILKTVAY